MNDDQSKRARIQSLADDLRPLVRGPMDWLGDLVFDMEDFVKGERTTIQQSADEWIADGEKYLTLRRAKA